MLWRVGDFDAVGERDSEMRMVRVLRAERGELYRYVEMSRAVAGMARVERRKREG